MADIIFPSGTPDATPESSDKIMFSDTSDSSLLKDCLISDLPISTLTQNALNLKENKSEKNANNGYAGLDATGKIPGSLLTPGIGLGDMIGDNNLSELTDESIARTNLGLGTLATQSGTFSDKEDIANKSTSVTTDQASNIKYPSVKSVYDWAVGAFAKYSGDADFYQYSISRTVDGSGNMTVALKNFEGNDPTPTKPVKIMIGGVVRTITSAVFLTMNAGINYGNSGSAELATKECDWFVYILDYNNAGTIFNIGFSRYPGWNNLSEVPGGYTSEKYLLQSGNIGVENVVNIGRFNAILSGGGAYTWSIPSSSVIVNRPIYETRELSYQPTATCDGGATLNGLSYYSTYIIKGNTLIKKIRVNWTSITGGTAYAIILKKPFQDNYGVWTYKTIGDIYDSGGHSIGQSFNDGSGNEYIGKYAGTALLGTSGSTVVNTIETI